MINTDNPEAITYETPELKFTILGGIRLDGLDRLRVTLKIEHNERRFKHYLNNPELAALAMRSNLDLYNDVQVEKLLRKTAERMEIGITDLSVHLAAITEELESYRIEQNAQRKERENEHRRPKQLTPEEQQEAVAFLSSPDLLTRTREMIAASGVVGEENNALLMYLIYTTRKRSNPLHVISLGASGTGKTHLQEKVSRLIPDEDKIEITTLSDNAFYYFERDELAHKLILIEDYDGVEGALYPIRELQSKHRISKTVSQKDTRGQTRTIHLTVQGPVSVSGCTTKERLYEDNANRSFLLYLDESTGQDERIMEYQRKQSAGRINKEEEKQQAQQAQNQQRMLRPIQVINPYAEQLNLPNEVLKPRRTNSHYLQFIEAVTYYHQYQREIKTDSQSGTDYIETTLEDIAAANSLMKEVLLRKSDDLTGAARTYFENLKAWLQSTATSSFTTKEARAALRVAHSTVKRYHQELTQAGIIQRVETKQEGKQEKGYRYEVVSYEEYAQLQQRITGVLDDILQNLQITEPQINNLQSAIFQSAILTNDQPNGSPTAHQTTEPQTAAQAPEKEQETAQENKQPTETQKKEHSPKKLPTSNNKPQINNLQSAIRNPQSPKQRIRIEDKEKHTLKIIHELEAQSPGREYQAQDIVAVTGRNFTTESRHLKTLYEQGVLDRIFKNRQYSYTLRQ